MTSATHERMSPLFGRRANSQDDYERAVIRRGAIVLPRTAYNLGAEWYATRLDRAWERAGSAGVAVTFARQGLVGEFWSLGWSGR